MKPVFVLPYSMAAAEQIKNLIKSFGEGDDSRFYATAMQIAAAEARNGQAGFADELKKLIDKAKGNTKKAAVIKSLPVNLNQKELSDLLELVHPKDRLIDMVLAPHVEKTIQRVLDEQRKGELLTQHNLKPRKKLLFVGPPGCGKTLSYVEVKNLKTANIKEGIDGGLWIFTRRQKTDTPSEIPLLPVPLALLEKYKQHPQCLNKGMVLPVLSNQKMNAYLKEIADVCGISKNITFHLARHTFATTVTLNNGVPLETVSNMLGHKSVRQTQHYARILNKKVSEDMNALKQKIGS